MTGNKHLFPFKKRTALFTAAFVFLYSMLFATVYFVANEINARNAPDKIDVATLDGKYDDSRTYGEYLDTLVNVPPKKHDLLIKQEQLAYSNSLNVLGKSTSQDGKVLSESDNKDKRIEIDLTNQKLYAFEGDKKIYEFLVSTGKWGRTPTGEFRIWTKLRYTKMSGGSKALRTYYYLPNVPFTMYFANNQIPAARGFGVHGTYWHNNFGHPMSHGCVNMKNEDAEKLYYWASPVLPEGKSSTNATPDNPGTKIVIYGKTPSS